MSLAGITYPNPSNQCWPFPMPFIYKQFLMQMIQQPDRITMLYSGDHEVRRVRLNEPHPSPLTPSWYGDSVGHYEGDTLVIDTVGVKTDRPYAMIDLFGTPYTDKLHIVERYRLRDYDDVKDAIERNNKENWLFTGDVFSKHRGKFLQLHVTIEDEGVFTTPWTATLTYVPGRDQIAESVCAENPHEILQQRGSGRPESREAGLLKGERPSQGSTFATRTWLIGRQSPLWVGAAMRCPGNRTAAPVDSAPAIALGPGDAAGREIDRLVELRLEPSPARPCRPTPTYRS